MRHCASIFREPYANHDGYGEIPKERDIFLGGSEPEMQLFTRQDCGSCYQLLPASLLLNYCTCSSYLVQLAGAYNSRFGTLTLLPYRVPGEGDLSTYTIPSVNPQLPSYFLFPILFVLFCVVVLFL